MTQAQLSCHHKKKDTGMAQELETLLRVFLLEEEPVGNSRHKRTVAVTEQDLNVPRLLSSQLKQPYIRPLLLHPPPVLVILQSVVSLPGPKMGMPMIPNLTPQLDTRVLWYATQTTAPINLTATSIMTLQGVVH